MKMPDEIIPAILSKIIPDFLSDLAKITGSKTLGSGWIHVDLMDNILVPNLSIRPTDMAGADFGNLRKEVHLMVKEPDEWITQTSKLGFERIIIHVEADNVLENITLIKKTGAQAVLAINPPTPVSDLEKYAKDLDGILVMGVNPGFQGQSFIPETLNKIKEIRSKGWLLKIEVDGAVKDWNAKDIIASGADILILGSFLIKGDPDENLKTLLAALS